MSDKLQRIGLLGGTFDPIHIGHLRIALESLQALGLAELRLLPCHLPAHRAEPGASTRQRIDMLRLATENTPRLVIDDREARRDSFSYSVDTLQSFRDEHPQARLLFIMGEDAFGKFTRWHRWQAILGLAHLVVVGRPGAQLGSDEEFLLMSRQCFSADALPGLSGGILRIAVPQLDISATRIRELIGKGQDIRYLVPDNVREYLLDEGLYQAAQ